MWRSSGKSKSQQEIKAIYPRISRIIIIIIIITIIIIHKCSDIIIGYVFIIKLSTLSVKTVWRQYLVTILMWWVRIFL